MKKIKSQIEQLNLNYKKEISRLIIFNALLVVAFIVLFIFSTNLIYLIYFFLIIFVFNFLYLSRYGRTITKNANNLIEDFIETFSYFRIYISNNMNVYTSLKEVSNYSSPLIKVKLLKLINEIDEDKTIKPFMNFASNFDSKKVEEVMIAIYEMVNEGVSEMYLNQFVTIFTSFKTRVEKTREEKRLSRFNIINTFSMAGMGLLMIITMLGTINMLGEVII